VQKQAAHTHTN